MSTSLFLVSLPLLSKVLYLYWCPWYSWTHTLSRVINIKLYFFLYSQRASKTITIHFRYSLHSIGQFLLLLKKKHVSTCMCIYFWVLDLIYWSTCLFCTKTMQFLIKIVLYYSLKGRDGESSRFFFSFSRIVLVILDFFFFFYHIMLWVQVSKFENM